MSLNIEETERGFPRLIFKDRYNEDCIIQKSSLATENTIWFGIKDVEPKIMASHAKKLGINSGTSQTTGWIKYNIPPEVLLNSTMHLTQEQVKELLPVLQHFAETGELSDQNKPEPMLIETYKVKILSCDTKRQVKKKVYESKNKFLKYGKDIFKRYHLKTFYRSPERYCEIYQMSTSGKWVQIEIPDEFLN